MSVDKYLVFHNDAQRVAMHDHNVKTVYDLFNDEVVARHLMRTTLRWWTSSTFSHLPECIGLSLVLAVVCTRVFEHGGGGVEGCRHPVPAV